jgi:hypothetical protein
LYAVEEDPARNSTDSGLDDYEEADGALSSPSATSRSSAEIEETEDSSLSVEEQTEECSDSSCRKCPACLPAPSPLWSQHRGSGAKYKLIHDGEVTICRLNHARTLISKILSSKYLRRWETHRLVLSDNRIYSKQVLQKKK